MVAHMPDVDRVHDWERKATAHAELFTILGDLTGDRDLERLVSWAAGRL